MYQRYRSPHQYSYQRWPSSGGTKNSISICSNSRVRKTKLPGVISLRNDLPTWAMPNGGFLRLNCRTFLKFTKMPCAVSGRLGRLARALQVGQVVGAEALAARAAVDHRVGEAGEVARRLPGARVLE